jgi:8-oxo-dGTP diphosphatase
MAATEAEARALAVPFAPLETERLRLRPLVPSDAAELFRLVNDWEVTRWLARVPFPYPRDLADEWIADTRARLESGEAYHLAITGRDDPVMLGCIGIIIDRATRTAELGYWVGRKFWGHGVGGEAAERFTSWALANLDIDRIEARVLTENEASHRVLARAGFVATGHGEAEFLARAATLPVTLYTATRLAPAPNAVPGAALAGAGGKPLLLVAAVALVDADTRVLLARRPEGKALAGLWEFPGGKVAQGETPEAALVRELKEELGIDVAASCLGPFAFASHAYENFHLLMPLYLCRRWKGRVEGREGQALAWVAPNKLAEYAMPPADKPLVAMLRDWL